MQLRSILLGALAVPLAATAAPAIDFSFGLGGRNNDDVVLAQAVDPRVSALEEQVRQLNGTIEELNFLILQMQEQMRKLQEDNEFRFQQLEGGGGERTDAGAGAGSAGSDAAAAAPRATAPAVQAAPAVPAAPAQTATGNATEPRRGQPPRELGTITFDENGNPTGGNIAPAPGQRSDAGTAADETTVAALPATSDPEELYRNSYEFILSGDYGTAEAGFRDYIARFPEDSKAADAHFWLGESLLGQERYRDAAEVFLAANREFPDSGKAPDMLLKLGVSLVALNQRDIACATFKEIGERYPQASGALAERVKQEQALAGC